MSGYIGNIPTPQATQTRDTFTATAGQTTFATSGYTPSFLDVFLNGVHLVNGTDYTASNGSDVVLTSGAAAGDTLEVVAYSTFEASDVTASSGFTVTGNLSVDGGTIKLDGAYPVGSNNVALGNDAFANNVSGAQNTALGERALNASTTTSWNTAVGYKSSFSNTSGTNLTSVGSESLISNTTGSNNTALGTNSLYLNTTASNNTAVGYQAGLSNTTGTINAVGSFALYANTTGTANVAVGGYDGTNPSALRFNTTGSSNTAVGVAALASNTTGNENTAVGQIALDANTTGYQNTAVGRNALGAATTGYSNTAVGQGAGRDITTGTRNTIVGRYSGNSGGLDIRTSSNYIVLSNGDGTPRGHFDNIGNWCVGGPYANPPSTYSFAQMTRTGILQSGRTGTGNQPAAEFFNGNGVVGSIYTNGSSTSYNTSSDYRLKENLVELTGATDRLKQIPVHRFNFTTDPDRTVDGFLAHEVQAIVPEAITGTKDEVDADGNPVYQGIDQSKLVPLLVATIKELEARIAALEAN